MAKTPKCEYCGKPAWNYHLMWDSRRQRVVKVCRDDRTCQAPYLTLQKKEA